MSRSNPTEASHPSRRRNECPSLADFLKTLSARTQNHDVSEADGDGPWSLVLAGESAQTLAAQQADPSKAAQPAQQTVNQDGIVYQKDLGPRTAVRSKALTQYAPDATWKKVD